MNDDSSCSSDDERFSLDVNDGDSSSMRSNACGGGGQHLRFSRSRSSSSSRHRASIEQPRASTSRSISSNAHSSGHGHASAIEPPRIRVNFDHAEEVTHSCSSKRVRAPTPYSYSEAVANDSARSTTMTHPAGARGNGRLNTPSGTSVSSDSGNVVTAGNGTQNAPLLQGYTPNAAKSLSHGENKSENMNGENEEANGETGACANGDSDMDIDGDSDSDDGGSESTSESSPKDADSDRLLSNSAAAASRRDAAGGVGGGSNKKAAQRDAAAGGASTMRDASANGRKGWTSLRHWSKDGEKRMSGYSLPEQKSVTAGCVLSSSTTASPEQSVSSTANLTSSCTGEHSLFEAKTPQISSQDTAKRSESDTNVGTSNSMPSHIRGSDKAEDNAALLLAQRQSSLALADSSETRNPVPRCPRPKRKRDVSPSLSSQRTSEKGDTSTCSKPRCVRPKRDTSNALGRPVSADALCAEALLNDVFTSAAAKISPKKASRSPTPSKKPRCKRPSVTLPTTPVASSTAPLQRAPNVLLAVPNPSQHSTTSSMSASGPTSLSSADTNTSHTSPPEPPFHRSNSSDSRSSSGSGVGGSASASASHKRKQRVFLVHPSKKCRSASESRASAPRTERRVDTAAVVASPHDRKGVQHIGIQSLSHMSHSRSSQVAMSQSSSSKSAASAVPKQNALSDPLPQRKPTARKRPLPEPSVLVDIVPALTGQSTVDASAVESGNDAAMPAKRMKLDKVQHKDLSTSNPPQTDSPQLVPVGANATEGSLDMADEYSPQCSPTYLPSPELTAGYIPSFSPVSPSFSALASQTKQQGPSKACKAPTVPPSSLPPSLIQAHPSGDSMTCDETNAPAISSSTGVIPSALSATSPNPSAPNTQSDSTTIPVVPSGGTASASSRALPSSEMASPSSPALPSSETASASSPAIPSSESDLASMFDEEASRHELPEKYVFVFRSCSICPDFVLVL